MKQRCFWALMVITTIVLGCDPEVMVEIPPVVKTLAASNVTATSAVLQGEIENEGATTITEYGFCWSVSVLSPSLNDNKVTVEEKSSFSAILTGLIPSKIYYVRAYAISSTGIVYGQTVYVKTAGSAPTVKSLVSDTTETSATIKLTVNSCLLETTVKLEYGLTAAYGKVVLDTVLNGCLTEFETPILSLNNTTKYYYRVEASNWLGSVADSGIFVTKTPPLPPPPSLTDVDGNVYKSVRIGQQIWLAENFKATHYNDGTEILNTVRDEDWLKVGQEGIGAYCYYNNDPELGKVYGALYNWYAIGTEKLAPKGWHVATKDDWRELYAYIPYGYLLVESGTSHWKTTKPDYYTNPYGFSALPGGGRGISSTAHKLKFSDLTTVAYWWCLEEYDNDRSLFLYIENGNLPGIGSLCINKLTGFSIRLVKD